MPGNSLRAEILKDTTAVRLADPDSLRQYDLRSLQYFLVLADTRNFTLASEHCMVTQPAITSQIRRLELQLGYTLFFRSAHGVELTVPGEAFRVAAREVWDAYEAMLDSMELWKRSRNGVVRLGLDHSAAARTISAALRGKGGGIGEHGRVEECDLEDWGQSWQDSLRNHKVDVVVATVFGHPPGSDDITIADVRVESGLTVIWNPAILPMAIGKMPLPALIDHPLILPDSQVVDGFEQRLGNWCRDAYGKQPVDFIATHSEESLAMACEAGLGIGLFPGKAEPHILSRMPLKVMHAFDDLFPRAKRVVVAWRKEDASNQRTALLQWLYSHLGEGEIPVARLQPQHEESDRCAPRFLLT